MNRWDLAIYQRGVKNHPMEDITEKEGDRAWQLIDYFYKGRPASDLTDALDDVRKVKLHKRITRGNLWRSVEAAYQTFKHLEQEKEKIKRCENKHDFTAAIQNIVTGPAFSEDLEEAEENQNTIQVMLSQGEGSWDGRDMDGEDLEFRNFLYNEVRKSKDFKTILQFFGHFYKHANKLKRERYTNATMNVAGMEQGNDLEEIATDEFLGLVAPELELKFLFEFAQEQLFQYEYKEKINTGKGPVNLLLDVSGSMEEEVFNWQGTKTKPINVACGFVIAMCKIMMDEGRDFNVYTFSWDVNFLVDSSVSSFREIVEAIMRVKTGGGTTITTALLKMYGLNDLDTVIVTDAYDNRIETERLRQAQGDRRASCLLVDGRRLPLEKFPLRHAVDSFILAHNAKDFEHLTEEFV